METIFTDQNFQKESATGLVLIDFWASWCGPCRIQTPIIGEIAEMYKGDAAVKVGMLNVDENPKVAQQFQIMSIPTIVILKNGKVIEQMNGLQPKETLIKKLKEHR